MKNIIASIALFALFIACEKKEGQITSKTNDYSIVGKKATITYPELKAEVFYISDSTLHWKTTDNAGNIAEGDEKINYNLLNENQFFINWIEIDGTTISQVIDTKSKKVITYLSYTDEESTRGKRAGIPIEGTFEFNN